MGARRTALVTEALKKKVEFGPSSSLEEIAAAIAAKKPSKKPAKKK